ncbi:MAG TPA: methyltransferase [Chitinophagaceae bacterium]|nr:methyltransferase [Chitinophagaceae bacterium]
MPNNYFRFKQFIIYQDKCAMKVCTDACLFGAIAAGFIAEKENIRVLDIGTGTGLLSLMCAQKNKTAIIEAVEIDAPAAQQASENFAASPWKERLTVQHISIQQLTKLSPPANASINQPFNFIISNPPFFENDLKSQDNKRNLALHSSELNIEELLYAVKILLHETGNFGVLLPYHRAEYFQKLAAEKGFYLIKKTLVKQTSGHDYFRSILMFGRSPVNAIQDEIVIMDAYANYSPAFQHLLQDYYLYL